MAVEEKRSYLCYSGGVAEKYNAEHPQSPQIVSLCQLIEHRAETFDGPIVGSPIKGSDGSWSCPIYTYQDLLNGVNAMCHHLVDEKILPRRTREDGTRQMTVALICPSNLDMMFTMLAIHRLGFASLLITPQQKPRVIKHLCDELDVLKVITTLDLPELNTVNVPDGNVWQEGVRHPPQSFERILTDEQEAEMWGIIYHSSGTTSGVPKPLPTKHRFLTAVNAFKRTDLATLTTTPLNTGGSADLCRSMCADAPLFIYPADVPITVDNVLRAREACSRAIGRDVGALSCVPYIAKMLAEDDRGLEMITKLEFLGVGGAPLPKLTGDKMVEAGVPLVSRMGSSECGFLMSSYRDFANDKDWDFLRSTPGDEHFIFRKGDDGTYELEVKGDWPALAVVPNLDNGNYKTGDVFEKHASTPGAWRYLGRNDDVITLENGKKADPKALEGTLRGLEYIRNALVFGVGKTSIGLLVLEREGCETGDALLDKLWPVVEKLNADAPSHAEVYRDMLVLLPTSTDFEKTPKGTVFRKGTYDKFAKQIDGAYGGQAAAKEIDDDDLDTYVSEKVTALSGKRLRVDDDLFNSGVNSMQSMRIRNVLAQELSLELPTNIVYEEPSIERLIRYIRAMRQGSVEKVDPLDQMRTLVNRYAYKTEMNGHVPRDRPETDSEVILLTGVTGGLGSHLLKSLLRLSPRKIICLIRGGQERVAETLSYREIELPRTDTEIEYRTVDAASLDHADFTDVTTIIHCAWPVNFNAGLSSFESSLQGLSNLLQLASRQSARFFFSSSTAAVIGQQSVDERGYDDPAVSAGVGYARAKWVAEQVVESWRGKSGARVHVLRIGQLYGDTAAGVWSEREGWPLLLKASRDVGAIPKLAEQHLTWLPVDIAADTITDLLEVGDEADALYYHVMNADGSAGWDLVLDRFTKFARETKVVEPKEWVPMVEKLEQDHPARGMLPLWRSLYGGGSSSGGEPPFSTTNTTRASRSLRESGPVDGAILDRCLATWRQRDYL